MRNGVAVLLISVFAISTSGQDSQASQTTDDGEATATASIHVDKHNFKSGEVIKFAVLLEAGPSGVYIPKSWGEAGGGIPGFFANLTTLSGKTAETCGMATDTWAKHEPDAKLVLSRDFIYLPPQQIVGLRTTINCPTKRRGKYLIKASYSPFHIDADEVAQLPETRGRVLRKNVQAKPVAISIY